VGDSLPPPASFDLVGSFARRAGQDAEIVIFEPKLRLPAGASPAIALRNGARSVHASVTIEETAHGKRLVARTARDQLTDGMWSLELRAGAAPERLDARLLVQGERPLVLLWGADSTPKYARRGRTPRRRAAAAGGRALDKALTVLPAERAERIRKQARGIARRLLR
jgi:hypothetical protein